MNKMQPLKVEYSPSIDNYIVKRNAFKPLRKSRVHLRRLLYVVSGKTIPPFDRWIHRPLIRQHEEISRGN